jgi:hypothetical protein
VGASILSDFRDFDMTFVCNRSRRRQYEGCALGVLLGA